MTIKSFLPAGPVEDMNIHEKRKYAKYIGVKSPTVLSLAALDEAIRIKELEIGAVREITGVYDMQPAERAALEYLINAQSRVTKGQSGYYYPFPEGDGVLRYETFKRLYEMDVYVPREIAESCGLKKGDLVSGDVITVMYNKTNILRSVKHINDHPVKTAAMRADFDLLQKTAPSKLLAFTSNNSIIGLTKRLLYVGEGQSAALFADEKTSQSAAYDLIVSLYRSFDGRIFSIYDPTFEDQLKIGYNPFFCTCDTDDENLDMLLERTKRLIEEETNVAIVAYTRNRKVLDALEGITGSYQKGTVTSFMCLGFDRADSIITVRGGKIILDETVNRYTSVIAGTETFKKLLQIREQLSDGTPDEVLAQLIKLTAQ